ncbi:hypothetical protein BDFB_008679, partial [Asbolus verrucosus]
QELRGGDYERRVRFCNFVQDKINQNEGFLKFVMFSDEAKFYNGGNGAVNRHQALENPHFFLWRVLKNKVHEIPFQDVDSLKNRIHVEILTRVRHSFGTRA